MILIEVTNIEELVRKNKGRVASLIGPWLTDVEAEVERVIIDQIKEAFERDGVRAHIVSVGGVNLRCFNLDLSTEEEETAVPLPDDEL